MSAYEECIRCHHSACTCGLSGRLPHNPRMAKRGYSKDFTPHGDSGKRYLLDEIPAGLWADVKAKCKRDGISIRALILKLLTEWTQGV
jgi:hypothetical protein